MNYKKKKNSSTKKKCEKNTHQLQCAKVLHKNSNLLIGMYENTGNTPHITCVSYIK